MIRTPLYHFHTAQWLFAPADASQTRALGLIMPLYNMLMLMITILLPRDRLHTPDFHHAPARLITAAILRLQPRAVPSRFARFSML